MSAIQSTIEFDVIQGQKLAEAGLSLAVETANAEHPKWSERCWQLFYQWLNRKPRYFEFMVETFRKYLHDYDLLELPKSNRAFGFVAKRAAKMGMIKQIGTGKVSNKAAHACNAGKWVKL